MVWLKNLLWGENYVERTYSLSPFSRLTWANQAPASLKGLRGNLWRLNLGTYRSYFTF